MCNIVGDLGCLVISKLKIVNIFFSLGLPHFLFVDKHSENIKSVVI